MTVGYVGPSMDAAVTDSGSKDLVFRNDTDAPIYIYTSVDDDYATVQIYGQRPPYRYVFHSVVVEDNIQPTGVSVRIDTEGRYATYTDEKVLVTEGKKGMRSELWRESYDWETGEKIDSLTVQISSDYYSPGNNIYYVGTQQRTTSRRDADAPHRLVNERRTTDESLLPHPEGPQGHRPLFHRRVARRPRLSVGHDSHGSGHGQARLPAA